MVVTKKKVIISSAKVKLVKPEAIHDFGIHEDKGNIHIHDNKKNTSFICNVANFYSWWKEGKSNAFSPTLIMTGNDGKGNPINAKFDKIFVGDKIDVVVTFESVIFGDSVIQIDEFIAGR